jgi:hypothetical protein
LPGIDIHHIDGDHSNADPSNLKAVTPAEHYEIHKSQKDYYAAYLIGQRMSIKPDDWTEMARENGKRTGDLIYKTGTGIHKWRNDNPELHREMCRENRQKALATLKHEQRGIFGFTNEKRKEVASLGGKKASELGLGFKSGNASAAGKVGGKKGGEYAKQNKTGIFALSREQIMRKNLATATTKMIKSGKACAWPQITQV